MIRTNLLLVTLLSAALPACAAAEPSLEDRVSVNQDTVTIEALRRAPSGDWDAREQARFEREAPVRDKRSALLSAFEAKAGETAFPTRFDIMPGFPQYSPWQVQGRITQDSAVYVALPLNWEVRSEGGDDITFCTVRFDTKDASEFDHFAVLFLVLSAGECSSKRLSDEALLADLTSPDIPSYQTEPLTIAARAERDFGDSLKVEVLVSGGFEPIYDWRSVPGDKLGGEGYRQMLTQRGLAGTRGWLETASGEVVTFFQSRDVQSAMCVYRGGNAQQVFEYDAAQMGFLRDTTPEFQRFCLEQLNAIDEEYKQRLLSDRRPIEIEIIED